MGGTRDFTPYVSKALMSHTPFNTIKSEDVKFNKCLVVSFNHSCDFEEVKDDVLTPFNRYTYLASTGEFAESQSDVLFIGPSDEHHTLQDHFNCKPIDEIRDSDYDAVEGFSVPILTKAAKFFFTLLREQREEYKFIQVDFNIGKRQFPLPEFFLPIPCHRKYSPNSQLLTGL